MKQREKEEALREKLHHSVWDAISETDRSKGYHYYREDRVFSVNTWRNHGETVGVARVLGSKQYNVRFVLKRNGSFKEGECTCPRYYEAGSCKHLAAALYAYADSIDDSVSSRGIRQLLQDYSALSAREELAQSVEEEPVRLVPQVSFSAPQLNHWPALTFRVGRDRLYVVRNVNDFLSSVEKGVVCTYGKGLSFRHSLEQFDSQSQALIRLLQDHIQVCASHPDHSYYSAYGPVDKNQVYMSGSSFDRFFDLYAGSAVELAGGKDTVLFSEEDPRLSMRIIRQENGALLMTENVSVFGSPSRLYVLKDDVFSRCAEEVSQKAAPLLSVFREELRIDLRDLPTFCGYVLPHIRDVISIEDPDGLLREYQPEDCTPCYYFDLQQDRLTAWLLCRYGENRISPGLPADRTPDIRRNQSVEEAAKRPLLPFFLEDGTDDKQGDRFVQKSEEDALHFLTSTLYTLQENAEVYLSGSLWRKRITPKPATVGVSLSDGLLAIDFDTGDFPPEELDELYLSLIQKKTYHRLRDGRYLALDGSSSSYETLAKAVHIAQLSPKQLASGHATLPAFRTLYLDAALGDSTGLKVARDQQFREMVRRFKTFSEGDYPVPEHLRPVLRSYQETGFQWLKMLESCHFGGILADEMGLGKTVQMLAFLSTVPKSETGLPSLIVCPASLVLNWAEELHRFAPQLSAVLILGTARERAALMEAGGEKDVWITSYDLLKRDIERYEDRSFYCCILDEGQYVKNQNTLVSKAVKGINCKQRFVMTGTPIENRLSELWNLFDFLMPGYLFSHHRFEEKLEKPIVKGQDTLAEEQLRRMVAPFLLRRLKSEVLKELPPKIEHTDKVLLSDEERRAYLATASAFRSSFADGNGEKLQILSALTRLRQICCDPNLCFENYEGETSKLERCIELCSGLTENGHQILLFSQFTSMLERIRGRLEKEGITSFTLQGSTPKAKRAELVRDFNAGKAQVFLISLKAGGTGLNLTAADVVIHYDPWWNIAAQNQATDRAHRIGQQSCVQVYRLIAKDTIEERILDLQEKKASLMENLMAEPEKSILSMSREELLALLE